MKAKHFLSQVDDDAILAAIRETEQKTSGRIHVFVSHHKIANPVIAAQKYFSRMHLDQTPNHDDVLIFVAPKSCNFAIIGDKTVHEKCGEQFWNNVANEMTGYFKQQQWTQALVHGIHKAGDLLAEHCPAKSQ